MQTLNLELTPEKESTSYGAELIGPRLNCECPLSFQSRVEADLSGGLAVVTIFKATPKTSSTDLPPIEKQFHFSFSASLDAGVAQRIINPPIGIRSASWGVAKTHVATGLHRDITTTALAVT